MANTMFLGLVYATLLLQLVITFGIVYKFHDNEKLAQIYKRHRLIFFLITLGIILALVFIPLHPALKLLLFTLFAVAFGFMLLSLTAPFPTKAIHLALFSVFLVFIGTSLLGLILTRMGYKLIAWIPFLLAALIAVIITEVVFLFIPPSSKVFHGLLIVIVILFSIFNVVDTNMILQKDYYGDYIQGAIDFYLNFINLFSAIFGLQNE
jgi:FtsH-binding integral membrane protein